MLEENWFHMPGIVPGAPGKAREPLPHHGPPGPGCCACLHAGVLNGRAESFQAEGSSWGALCRTGSPEGVKMPICRLASQPTLLYTQE